MFKINKKEQIKKRRITISLANNTYEELEHLGVLKDVSIAWLLRVAAKQYIIPIAIINTVV